MKRLKKALVLTMAMVMLMSATSYAAPAKHTHSYSKVDYMESILFTFDYTVLYTYQENGRKYEVRDNHDWCRFYTKLCYCGSRDGYTNHGATHRVTVLLPKK